MTNYYDITFAVNKNLLYRTGVRTSLPKGSLNYLRCNFKFDDSWDNKAKIAVFKVDNTEYPVKLENNSCLIPNGLNNKETIQLYLIGLNRTQRIETNNILLIQE